MEKVLNTIAAALLLSVSVAQAAPTVSGLIPLTKGGWILAVKCSKGAPINGIAGAVTMPDEACGTNGLASKGAAVTCAAVLTGGTCQLTLPTGFSTCELYGGDGIEPVAPGTPVTFGGEGNPTHFNCKK